MVRHTNFQYQAAKWLYKKFCTVKNSWKRMRPEARKPIKFTNGQTHFTGKIRWIYVFTFAFDQYNESLLNKSMHLFIKKGILTPNVWTVVYVNIIIHIHATYITTGKHTARDVSMRQKMLIRKLLLIMAQNNGCLSEKRIFNKKR